SSGASNTLMITGDGKGNSVSIRLKSGDASTTEVVYGTNVASFANASLTSINAQLGGGNDTLQIDSSNGNPIPSGGMTYDGGAGTDTLFGPNSANSWVVTAANGGTLNSSNSFTSVENLVGGTGDDAVAFGSSGSLDGAIDGSAGTNSLDYSGRSAA